MNFEYIDNYISMALMEDLGQAGDITTNATIGENLVSSADVIYKTDGVLAGVSHALRVFDILAKTLNCPTVKVLKKTADGTAVKKRDGRHPARRLHPPYFNRREDIFKHTSKNERNSDLRKKAVGYDSRNGSNDRGYEKNDA